MTEIKKPLRRVAAGTIWHFFDGVKVNGPHGDIYILSTAGNGRLSIGRQVVA